MNYWLIKSEPSAYSIDALKADKQTFWSGGRNYAARNNMQAMKKGDMLLFYHSVVDPAVVGLAKVVKESYQDPTTDDKAWVVVDVAFVKKFKTPVTLPQIKQDKALATVTKKLRKEDGHIKWDRPQIEIETHIRAMTPWPSAYAWIPQEKDHKMLKIFTTIVSRRAKGKPGEIVRVDKHGILVAAGVGGLLLREVQLEGKKRMHAAEFARGFNLPVGLVFE